MKIELIMERGDYALILRGLKMEEYAVVNSLDKANGEWAWTCCYYNFGKFSSITQAQALAKAIDYFRQKTEENYIPRCRLEELATKFKDKMVEFAIDCGMSDTDFEYEMEDFEMENYEKEFFGLHDLEMEDE